MRLATGQGAKSLTSSESAAPVIIWLTVAAFFLLLAAAAAHSRRLVRSFLDLLEVHFENLIGSFCLLGPMTFIGFRCAFRVPVVCEFGIHCDSNTGNIEKKKSIFNAASGQALVSAASSRW